MKALHDYVQEPGWYMLKPANPAYPNYRRIAEYFKDDSDGIKTLCKRYLRTANAVSRDFDEHMREIVESQAWQQGVNERIAFLGEFAGETRVLLGRGL